MGHTLTDNLQKQMKKAINTNAAAAAAAKLQHYSNLIRDQEIYIET